MSFSRKRIAGYIAAAVDLRLLLIGKPLTGMLRLIYALEDIAADGRTPNSLEQ
jgi:hypothetical protein